MKGHWWFQGESVRELVKRLANSGRNPRLIIRQDEEDLNKLWLDVEPEDKVTDGGDDPPINDSHRCPPDCG